MFKVFNAPWLCVRFKLSGKGWKYIYKKSKEVAGN